MNKEQQIEELHDFILNNLYKGSTHLLAEKLYDAGYGNVSEYKAERELLGSQIKALKQRLNNKYIEIERLKADKKQAQIDVLNKVKEHLFFGVSLGFLRLYVDELIREVEKQ